MRATRAIVDPAVCFTRPEIDRIVDDVLIQEAALRDSAGALPLSKEDKANLRNMVLFRICAEIPPSGNA